MKPEQQRIAIAEACGWRRVDTYFSKEGRKPKTFIWNDEVPDYFNDLNAMREAEKWLLKFSQDQPTDAIWKEYRIRLEGICGVCLAFHATAAQRAEAFLRTIGKWKD